MPTECSASGIDFRMAGARRVAVDFSTAARCHPTETGRRVITRSVMARRRTFMGASVRLRRSIASLHKSLQAGRGSRSFSGMIRREPRCLPRQGPARSRIGRESSSSLLSHSQTKPHDLQSCACNAKRFLTVASYLGIRKSNFAS